MKNKDYIFVLLFGWRFFKKGLKFFRGSYIREHSVIRLHGGTVCLKEKARIYPYCRIQCNNSNSRIDIGAKTFIGYRFTCLCNDLISIGDNCLIASDVFISDYNHSHNIAGKYTDISSKPVIIGKNCWIGEKVIILPGVTIGCNSIVGAGSVVTKDIAPNCIAVGNPAKVIKKYDSKNNEWVKLKDKE